jgi:hypothetical protein
LLKREVGGAVAEKPPFGACCRTAELASWDRLPIGSNPKELPMSDTITRHDARALALIDHALSQGFTAELVAQIREALASASCAESDYPSSVAAHG